MTVARASATKAKPVRSILALAAGATAAPLTDSADAAIIVDSSLNGTVIGWNTGAGQTRSVTRSLPVGGFTINTRATVSGGGSTSGNKVGVVAAWAGAGNGLFRRGGSGSNPAFLAAYGATMNAGAGAAAVANVNLGFLSGGSGYNLGNPGFLGPPSKYLLFNFDNAGTTNYGWIEITSSVTGFSGTVSAYSATLGDWAYDDSGAQITAGQVPVVPEPSSAALAMGGALVAGAEGLRRWRKQRAAAAGGTTV